MFHSENCLLQLGISSLMDLATASTSRLRLLLLASMFEGATRENCGESKAYLVSFPNKKKLNCLVLVIFSRKSNQKKFKV